MDKNLKIITKISIKKTKIRLLKIKGVNREQIYPDMPGILGYKKYPDMESWISGYIKLYSLNYKWLINKKDEFFFH